MQQEFTLQEFKSLIELYKLKSSYTTLQKDGKNLIVEIWKSKTNPFIVLSRTFELNEKNLDTIEPKKRKKLLQKLLEDAVQIENYEEAAQLRDMIQLL